MWRRETHTPLRRSELDSHITFLDSQGFIWDSYGIHIGFSHGFTWIHMDSHRILTGIHKDSQRFIGIHLGDRRDLPRP